MLVLVLADFLAVDPTGEPGDTVAEIPFWLESENLTGGGYVGIIVADIADAEIARYVKVYFFVVFLHEGVGHGEHVGRFACADIEYMAVSLGHLDAADGSVDHVVDVDEVASFLAVFKDVDILAVLDAGGEY